MIEKKEKKIKKKDITKDVSGDLLGYSAFERKIFHMTQIYIEENRVNFSIEVLLTSLIALQT